MGRLREQYFEDAYVALAVDLVSWWMSKSNPLQMSMQRRPLFEKLQSEFAENSF